MLATGHTSRTIRKREGNISGNTGRTPSTSKKDATGTKEMQRKSEKGIRSTTIERERGTRRCIDAGSMAFQGNSTESLHRGSYAIYVGTKKAPGTRDSQLTTTTGPGGFGGCCVAVAILL